MHYRTLDQADLKNKRVLLRAGFDVKIENGKVMETERIEALVPTMKRILQNAALIILSHQGRPKGKRDPAFSQEPIVPELARLLGTTVHFCADVGGPNARKAAEALKPGEVLLLENLRYEPGEEENDAAFAKELAALGDIYVNDAFTNCHRKHASMVALAQLLPAYAGLQLEKELTYLSKVVDDPARPLALIVSGSKMETKVPVIQRFLSRGDDILLGGCIANTFIAARGFDVGKSRYDQESVVQAQEFMLESEKKGNAVIHVPRDAVVAASPDGAANALDLPLEDIGGDMAMFDIGTVTTERYLQVLEKAATIVWNGPMGMYEVERFAGGTKRLAEALRQATKRGATTIIGGGDTLDFHVRYGEPLDAYTFVSTGGGAMLEFIAGEDLPALQALRVA